MRNFHKIVFAYRPGRQHLGCLVYRGSFSPIFINPTFRFSLIIKYENLDCKNPKFANICLRYWPTVKYKNLDHKKSEIFKHPSFRYWPIVKYENLDFKKSEISKHPVEHPAFLILVNILKNTKTRSFLKEPSLVGD